MQNRMIKVMKYRTLCIGNFDHTDYSCVCMCVCFALQEQQMTSRSGTVEVKLTFIVFKRQLKLLLIDSDTKIDPSLTGFSLHIFLYRLINY